MVDGRAGSGRWLVNRAEAAKKLHVRKSVLIEALESFRKGGPENEGAAERTGTT